MKSELGKMTMTLDKKLIKRNHRPERSKFRTVGQGLRKESTSGIFLPAKRREVSSGMVTH